MNLAITSLTTILAYLRSCHAVVTGMNLVVIIYILCAGLPFGRLENLAPFAPHGADQVRQPTLDLVGAHAGDQGEPARLVLRVQPLDQT